MVRIFDPLITMRKDGNRVVAYPKGEAAFNTEKDYSFGYKIIPPKAAIALALFDGQRTDGMVAESWAELTGFGLQSAQEDITAVLSELGDLLTEVEHVPMEHVPYDPITLVCNARELEGATWRLHTPNSMLFLPTLQCGFRCLYCYADYQPKRDPNEMSLVEIERILDECRDLQFASVSLSGGDPFLRKDIFEIIAMLYDRGYREDIPTKSPLNESQIKRLRDIGARNIQLSLDSPLDAGVVERHVGKKGYFPKIMRTLHRFGDEGFNVGITCVLTKFNIDSVPEIIEYFGNLGFVNRVSFTLAASSIYRDFHEIFPHPNAMQSFENRGPEFRERYPHMFIKLDSVPDPYYMSVEERREWYAKRAHCSGGRYAFVLLPDGRVTLCEELYYHPEYIVGDLRHQSIPEMWNSPEMMRVMEPVRDDFVGSPCFECEEFDECHRTQGRCWKRALKAYRDQPNAAHWPDPYCPSAPQLTQRLGE